MQHANTDRREKLGAGRVALGALCVLMAWCVAEARAAEVVLKNSLRLVAPRKPTMLQTFGLPPANLDESPVVRPIAVLDNGYQRIYFPVRQIAEGGLDLDADLDRTDVFDIPRKRQARGGQIGAVSLPSEVTPWDENGLRRVTFSMNKKPVHVIQGISRVSPRHVTISSLSHLWEYGVSTKTVPGDVLANMLRRSVDADNVQNRFAVVRFYLQAELYSEALAELLEIVRLFPERRAQAEELTALVRTAQGRQFLAELKRRRDAGQYDFAESLARKLVQSTADATIIQEANAFVAEFDHANDAMARVRIRLGELQAQAKLPDAEAAEAATAMRSEVSEGLSHHALPWLEPFLQVESDGTIPADDKLALAYSGWLLGPEHAVDDLFLTLRLATARALLIEALRSSDRVDLDDAIAALKRVEGAGVDRAAQLLRQLAPWRDASDVAPGAASRIKLTPESMAPAAAHMAAQSGVEYCVVLPAEYSPQRKYPAIVALAPAELPIDRYAEWWAGSPESAGPANRRGYVVIVPRHLAEGEQEFRPTAESHAAIAAALRDARQRFRLDDDRIVLAGHGAGADAAWEYAVANPEPWAGVVAFCAKAHDNCRMQWKQAMAVDWFFVAGELHQVTEDRNWLQANLSLLDSMYKHGARCDVVSVVYSGRGYEWYGEELDRVFDWLDARRRGESPREFEGSLLQPIDGGLFWLTAHGLRSPPATARGDSRKIPVKGYLKQGSPAVISVNAPAESVTVRLTSPLIDFEKRVSVKFNDRVRFTGYLKPEVASLVDDLRETGDRVRMAAVRLRVGP